MKFVCDDNLGRLARWLRTLGFDTVFDSEITDDQVLTVALSEQRKIITRDHRLAENTLARQLVLLSSGNPLEQLKNVLQRCAVAVEASRLFSICPLCNIKVESINKEEFAAGIPPYVYRTQDRFTRCPGCERIFWRGTHVERIKEHLAAAGIVIK
jgi:uncharacterized protein with PIN domain